MWLNAILHLALLCEYAGERSQALRLYKKAESVAPKPSEYYKIAKEGLSILSWQLGNYHLARQGLLELRRDYAKDERYAVELKQWLAEVNLEETRFIASKVGIENVRLVWVSNEGVFPQSIHITPKTTILWVNMTEMPTSIVFSKGYMLRAALLENLVDRTVMSDRQKWAQVIESWEKKIGAFHYTADGQYVSDKYEPGEARSLSFLREGKLNFLVGETLLRPSGIGGVIKFEYLPEHAK